MIEFARVRKLLLSAAFPLGLMGACATDPGSDGDCVPGSLYCECSAGQCQIGLECVANFCVSPNSETGGDADAGDGDGDGDPTTGDGDGDNGCDPGLSFCGGKCVDTQDHPLHCGGCDMPCGDGGVCDAGSCVVIQDCTMEPCPGFSYCDLLTMKCLPGCSDDAQCTGGETCNLDTHECDCSDVAEVCTANSECGGGYCYIVPFLGGMCGECVEDANCENGCTAPNFFGPGGIGPNCLPLSGSYCNDGSAGEGCETDAACQPNLSCELALDLLGLIEIRGCSECTSDADCGGGQICSIVVDLGTSQGQKACMAPGSMAQDEICDLEGNGDQACASGICSTVDIMGLSQIGVCGECNTDADCGGGTCVPGELVLDTGVPVGSTCI